MENAGIDAWGARFSGRIAPAIPFISEPVALLRPKGAVRGQGLDVCQDTMATEPLK